MNNYDYLLAIINLLIPLCFAVLGWQVGVKLKENRDMKRTWSEENIQYLKDNYEKLPHREMSIALGKTNEAVRAKCQVLGLRKPADIIKKIRQKMGYEANKHLMLTAEEDEFVKENYLSIPVKSLAKMLSRGQTAVRGSLKRQGLVIPQELADYRKGINFMRKGQIAYNKGKPQTSYMTPEGIERTLASRFKKGTIPPNTVAVGTEVASKGGYIKVKIGEPNIWIFKQRMIWQQHFGEIPDQHLIIFSDGNILNFNIENLACIKRGQHIRRACISGKYEESILSLSDNYVADIIKRKTSLRRDEIPKALIDLKREGIKINRELKKIEQNESK